MIDIEALESHIRDRFNNSNVHVSDMTGGGDHFEISVVSSEFEGLNRIERHRLLHEIVESAPGGHDIHAVKFKTLTPSESKNHP